MRNDVLQNYLIQLLKCLADNFDNLKFHDASKVAIFRPPNSYILHCHSESGLFTIYLENHEFYTCTLWDHNTKFLIKAFTGNSWVPNDCILVGINKTK